MPTIMNLGCLTRMPFCHWASSLPAPIPSLSLSLSLSVYLTAPLLHDHYKSPTQPHSPAAPTSPPPALTSPPPSATTSNRSDADFTSMALHCGFEGFEKRLELHFTGDDPVGLRRLSSSALNHVLAVVQCGIVSAVGNAHFDSYVLSESSLFIYPLKLIIKTCGTTGLLRSIPLFLLHAASLGLHPLLCKYTRGSFIFPLAQPFPHTTFKEEVLYLDRTLPAALSHRKAQALPSHSTKFAWHVYSATTAGDPLGRPITLEVCMTELDRAVASRFFRRPEDAEAKVSGHDAGKEMTARAGITGITPAGSFICDFAFDPCGYSMNGLAGDRYSTIHVTPEEGYSYASFECEMAEAGEMEGVLEKVNAVFRPGVMSVSVSGFDGWVEIPGMTCRSRTAEEFPGAGAVTYQTFVDGDGADCWAVEGGEGKERGKWEGEWECHDRLLH
ncbi:S-adenosylmethionine decarboxylase proenzyme [Apostasia shenzhenica]|uniref:adenosylmethionine decarboxylase n=1 Tax=Apostasia shenzhenica TaxID=1088818 RepID=A0A2H9ZZ79_9ASPA|nr:S-adenosylmethionine decarboxylase proenzyme [Apostasia shenzhenica]